MRPITALVCTSDMPAGYEVKFLHGPHEGLCLVATCPDEQPLIYWSSMMGWSPLSLTPSLVPPGSLTCH